MRDLTIQPVLGILHQKLAKVFVDNFISSYDNKPNIIALDFDDTEDQVHGDQQLALFNKYFDSPEFYAVACL